MIKEKQSNAETVSPKELKKMAEAGQLHQQIVTEWALVNKSITRVAASLKRMRDSGLWKYLHARRYQSFHEYVKSVTGAELGQSRMYELLAAHGLTEGENSIPPETVNEMGIKKAAQLARLEPQQRTPDVVKKVVEAPLFEAKRIVQETINSSLPREQRREPLVLLSRNVLPQTLELIEETERDGIYMEGIRDGDFGVTLRAKLWHAIFVSFNENHRPDLDEGRKYRLALEARGRKKSSVESAFAIEMDDDDLPEPEEFSATAG
jgi:hypothetical protein